MNELIKSEQVQADIEAVLGLDRKRSWLRRLRAPLIILVIAALAAAAFMLWRDEGSGNGVNYVTEPVTKGDLTVTVTATGTVQPTNEVEVSSELSGIVRTVLVDYNSAVKTGQTIAELDTDKLKATVDSSKAKLQSAKAKVAEAEASVLEARLEYDRKEKLVAKKVSSEQELELAEAAHQRNLAALESAKADVSAAEADLALNETNLAKAVIRSPITGVVLSRNVEPGQTVASSLQAPVLFTIAEDLAKMEVQVDVDEADVGKVQGRAEGDLHRRCLSRPEVLRHDPGIALRLRGGAGRRHLQGGAHDRQHRVVAAAGDDGHCRDHGGEGRRRRHRAQRGAAVLAAGRQRGRRQAELPAKDSARHAALAAAEQSACRYRSGARGVGARRRRHA